MTRRIPSWIHPQAANRKTDTYAWRPGWHGTGMQRIRVVPVLAFSSVIPGVPLSGGQAQVIVKGYAAVTGSVTSPAASQTIALVSGVPAGTYTISWSVSLSGTLSSNDANNFVLKLGAVTLATSVNAAAAGTYVQSSVTATALAGQSLLVQSGSSTPTTGAVYGATLPSGALPATVKAGPQGLGNVWYPAAATISTTTGALDTSTAQMYLGATGLNNLLVGQSYSAGGDTLGLSVPAMRPGDYLIVVWSGANPGDQATVNITGTMDALSF